MNENQENIAAEPVEPSAAAEAPKKRRAPRKVAAEAVVADVAAEPTPAAPAEEAPKKRRAPRKAAAEAVAADVAAEPTPVAPAEEAPKKRRAPRKAAAATEPVAEAVAAPSVASAEPVEMPEPIRIEPVAVAVEAAPAVTPEPVLARAEPAAEDEAGEGGGRRGRNRRRGRRGERDGEANGAEAVSTTEDGEAIEEIIVAPDTGELDTDDLFAEVISGDYDASAEPAADEQADLGKRVLSPDPMAPKLHKVLAQAGIGSRREMEQLIQDGQVSVNGEAAHIGMRIEQGDQIRIAGRPIKVRIAPAPARVLAYHKQVGEVVTHHDPEGRPTVFRHLPRLHSGKWLSVGRLDINTEGLLLFTNSGDLANQLMHPRFGVEREYAVRVLGTLETEQRAKLLEGVDIDGQKAAFRSIEDGGGEGLNRWYRVVITEGRNREVRKLFDAVGLTVSRLIRIRYGTVVLPRGLKRGAWVEIGEYDLRTIRALAGMDSPRAGGDGGRRGRGRDGERGADRADRAERGGRGDQPGRGKGSQHGGDRGPRGAQAEPRAERAERGERAERQDRPDRPDRQDRRQGGQGMAQGPQGKKPRPSRGEGGAPRGASGRDRVPEQDRDLDGYDEPPMHIPNPLEQTFDRRFASGSKRISAGFGRPTEEPGPGNGGQGGNRKGQGQGGGQRQPDPMQTSVGYIGADAYFARPGGNKGRGGRRR
ncbi:pseudouridine synthase [Sphaerotilus natans subsp. natans DSM 6575]|uniref:Pseudouridine synthase n=1 Tax=Sphaerotilus natans subsp. natans DSM 6575 TaxID=1286631 RepID=A0A059KMU8_9BURK|nr:pseudouridine synthase [Sphaerotilus natans]KDB52433.1 pseudouridine synthase [Sphaerotilus natans subsp. natans DSM 6575]SIR71222.1 23S rRNA pseudouridine2605 synthase [Sphaerotilus natans]